jgi:diguanylate cyclase (GGDEF)-like protein
MRQLPQMKPRGRSDMPAGRPLAVVAAGQPVAPRPRAPARESGAEVRYSWLCPTATDRDRFFEMQGKLKYARFGVILMSITIAAAMLPEYGWSSFAALVPIVALVLGGAWRLERRRRPELWVFYTTVVNSLVCIGIAAALAGGPRTPLVCMVAVPVAIVATRFSTRGLLAGVPMAVAVILLTTLGIDPGYVAHHPESIGVPLSLVGCFALYMHPLVSSDVRHRTDSTLDALTGLLNRRALNSRMREIAQQASLTGQPVSFLAADLDHFKEINDKWGHSVGDEVLREIAQTMRRSLRTFELLYRIGGEEFLLVLPGAHRPNAFAVAQAIRAAIASSRPAGLAVTCSIGIATAYGTDVQLGALSAAADTALYTAKRRGRNRVEVHERS